MISIITPVYNCEAFLDETIKSVILQSYADWELLLIDDCSQDGSKALSLAWAKKDDRIKVFSTRQNGGPAVARNIGLAHARGSYIAFLDSDDVWTKDKLWFQLGFMEKNKVKFSCTSYISRGASSEPYYKFTPPQYITYNEALLLGNPIGNSTVMLASEVLNDIKVPDIKKRNDFALWLQILKKGIVCYGIDKPTMIYRRRSGSVSSKKISLLPYHWDLYRNIESLTVFKSTIFIATWAVSKTLHLGRSKVKNNALENGSLFN